MWAYLSGGNKGYKDANVGVNNYPGKLFLRYCYYVDTWTMYGGDYSNHSGTTFYSDNKISSKQLGEDSEHAWYYSFTEGYYSQKGYYDSNKILKDDSNKGNPHTTSFNWSNFSHRAISKDGKTAL